MLMFCFLTSTVLHSQSVGIKQDGSAPNPNAILDVDSPDKGVLLPRTDTIGITSAIKGMMIFDTLSNGFMYYNGSKWLSLFDETAFSFYYVDKDGDGYGDPYNVVYAPSAPQHYVSNNEDCDDSSDIISPTATEICDGVDNDCDGEIDELGIGICLIDEECYNAGDINPENECETCDPFYSSSAWYLNCGPGMECCNGQCIDITSDVNHCGACNQPCNDGLGCTIEDCAGSSCYVVGIEDLTCFIDGTCYRPGDPHPTEVCKICDPGQSQTAWTSRPSTYACGPCGGFCDGVLGICNELACITIDWANTQFPLSTSTTINVPSEQIYGQVYVSGVTDAVGQASGIIAELGYGPDGSDPSLGGWIWVNANYNADAGNNDEYVSLLQISMVGTFDYAYRFTGDFGNSWVYADTNGTNDGYDSSNAGSIVVNP